MREAGETWPLTKKFQELLFRHQGEFTHPELYQVARSGTLHVVTDFLDEIEACLHYLIALEVDGVGDDYKLAQLKRVGRVYGRPALLLSGGALLGLYHFGVIKTLFEQDLLPRTISGSSMGSIMAAWTCCHTDDELRTLFADLSLINTDALQRLPMREMLRQRTVMDQPKLLKFLGTVMPDMTFDESLQHSRRILNVTVSPLNKLQTPRLLNYLSAPEALVRHAVLASCAVPLVFKPVQLMARQRGVVKPWMENELWVDGSVSGDLPFTQLTQMLNINHYITSQANPHIVPFLSLQADGQGVLPAMARMGGNIVRRARPKSSTWRAGMRRPACCAMSFHRACGQRPGLCRHRHAHPAAVQAGAVCQGVEQPELQGVPGLRPPGRTGHLAEAGDDPRPHPAQPLVRHLHRHADAAHRVACGRQRSHTKPNARA